MIKSVDGSASTGAVWVPVAVAVIGVMGSVIVAYITTGARFEDKFTSMQSTIAELTSRLDTAGRTSQTLQSDLKTVNTELVAAQAELVKIKALTGNLSKASAVENDFRQLQAGLKGTYGPLQGSEKEYIKEPKAETFDWKNWSKAAPFIERCPPGAFVTGLAPYADPSKNSVLAHSIRFVCEHVGVK